MSEERTSFHLDPDRGFLPRQDPLQRLSSPFLPWEEAALELPQLLVCQKVRSRVAALPPFDTSLLSSVDELERAMALLSFLGHAYVWGEGSPAASIPERLALPWYRVGRRLGRPPVLSYASYALHNWRRLDLNGPVALGNIALVQNFLGGIDEEWFVLVHVEIEAKAAPGLAALRPARQAVEQGDETAVERRLEGLAESLEQVCAVLERMPEGCDPYIYYHRVRPYLHGWEDHPALPDGLVYEGVEEYAGRPQRLRGETGAQSAIVPALDGALGIRHRDDPLRRYLKELRAYLPPAHLAFIEEMEQGPSIRRFVERCGAGRPSLEEAYNACIVALGRFRAQHLEYAATYVHKQAQSCEANPTAVGTGGTPFMKYLKKHQEETEAHML